MTAGIGCMGSGERRLWYVTGKRYWGFCRQIPWKKWKTLPLQQIWENEKNFSLSHVRP